MNGDIDPSSVPAVTTDEAATGEPAAQTPFPTREDALALALKIAGPKRHEDDAAPN